MGGAPARPVARHRPRSRLADLLRPSGRDVRGGWLHPLHGVAGRPVPRRPDPGRRGARARGPTPTDPTSRCTCPPPSGSPPRWRCCSTPTPGARPGGRAPGRGDQAGGPVVSVAPAVWVCPERVGPGELHGVARVVRLQEVGQVVGGADRLAVEAGDHVTLDQSGLGRRRSGQRAVHLGPGGSGARGPAPGAAAEAAEAAAARPAARPAARAAAGVLHADAQEAGGADVDGVRGVAGLDLLGQSTGRWRWGWRSPGSPTPGSPSRWRRRCPCRSPGRRC